MSAPALYDPATDGWVQLDDPGYAHLIGPFWQRVEGDSFAYGLMSGCRHLNRNGTIHGGVVLGLADQTLGRTSLQATGGLKQATIQLDVQFISAPLEGEFLIARGTVIRRTRSLTFMRGDIMVGDRMVATANGMWKILGT